MYTNVQCLWKNFAIVQRRVDEPKKNILVVVSISCCNICALLLFAGWIDDHINEF